MRTTPLSPQIQFTVKSDRILQGSDRFLLGKLNESSNGLLASYVKPEEQFDAVMEFREQLRSLVNPAS